MAGNIENYRKDSAFHFMYYTHIADVIKMYPDLMMD